MTALDDAINQNTRADDTVHPLGIPTDYGMYGGAVARHVATIRLEYGAGMGADLPRGWCVG